MISVPSGKRGESFALCTLTVKGRLFSRVLYSCSRVPIEKKYKKKSHVTTCPAFRTILANDAHVRSVSN